MFESIPLFEILCSVRVCLTGGEALRQTVWSQSRVVDMQSWCCLWFLCVILGEKSSLNALLGLNWAFYYCCAFSFMIEVNSFSEHFLAIQTDLYSDCPICQVTSEYISQQEWVSIHWIDSDSQAHDSIVILFWFNFWLIWAYFFHVAHLAYVWNTFLLLFR